MMRSITAKITADEIFELFEETLLNGHCDRCRRNHNDCDPNFDCCGYDDESCPAYDRYEAIYAACEECAQTLNDAVRSAA